MGVQDQVQIDGFIRHYKSCLVGKDYMQQEGVDFNRMFSPVAKLVPVILLLTLAATQHWHLTQLKVNNVFFNTDLHEEVYMDLPLGYQSKEFLVHKFVNSTSSFIDSNKHHRNGIQNSLMCCFN